MANSTLVTLNCSDGAMAICRVERTALPYGGLVIVFEIVDSRLNDREGFPPLLERLAERLGVEAEWTVWIEHVTVRPLGVEFWCRVFLDVAEDKSIVRARWKRMTRRDWTDLGLDSRSAY